MTLSLALTDMPQVRLDAMGMARGLVLTIVLPVVTGHSDRRTCLNGRKRLAESVQRSRI